MRIILFGFLTFAPLLVNAQEQTPATEEKDVQIEKTVVDTDVERNSEILTPDTFDPTEKLSEDFPVAFPVDI